MKTTRLWIGRLLTGWLPESRCFGLKNALLRWAGAEVGRNVRIYSSARFSGTGRLVIGDDVHVGGGAVVVCAAPASVTIGNCVDIGPQAMILTGSHVVNWREEPDDPLAGHAAGMGTASSVEIADGCWLGARSVILPGVRLAGKTVVAAGAVVTRSSDRPKTLLAGVPAVMKGV